MFCCFATCLWAQEATSGFDLKATVSGQVSHTPLLEAAPRSGGPLTGGFRSMLYPTWKLNERWAVSGAIQMHSRPYFYEEFSRAGTGVKAHVLQAHLSYSRFWKDGSVIIRLGQLSSAFGSFLLRYDDARNPLIDIPIAYGYYYKPVSNLGLAGAQVEVTLPKLDLRAQFTNSSPANPRSILDRDQYGNWTAGAGYTIGQGFRVGVSAYRGPHLHRGHRSYRPGEARPRDLPGSAYGIDVAWGHGRWNLYGEWQKFQKAYRARPTFNQHIGYAEARCVLHPRWYIASRAGYMRASAFRRREVYEVVGGFRPNRYQVAKIGYQIQRDPDLRGAAGNAFSLQLVTTLVAVSIARD